MRIQRQSETFAYRVAAVNQNLVDRLYGEFTQWHAENNPGYDGEEDWTPGADPNDTERGPIGDWKNIENFMQAKYPAAYRGHSMGAERARPLLDVSVNDPASHDPYSDTRNLMKDERGRVVPKPSEDRVQLYETGLEAHQKHGYDPSEIAAGMLLLHNQSHPFRGDMLADDQKRLNDIFDKRQKMQRNYEQRSMVGTTLDDYRWERDRQIRQQERTTGGYDTDTQDYYDHGGQRAITLKDWMRSRKPGPGEQAAAAAGVDPHYVHQVDPSWNDEGPAW